MSDATATARLIFDASNLKAGVKDANQSLGTLYEVVRDNWWGIRNVGLAFGAVGGAISAGVGSAVKAAADFEQGMLGVARTTYDASQSAETNAAAVAKLGDALKAVAASRPIDLKSIVGIAEEAGALGVASKDIATFTGSIADLVATTNLTAESATLLARVQGIFGQSAGQVGKLGSAIFETGRSTAATESEILKMTVRFAGAGKAAGLTEDQVVGLSAAVLSLGPKSEAATSAIQRTFSKFAEAVAGGGADLQNFATIAGVSAKEFDHLVRSDPGKALTLFVQGLGKSSSDIVNVTSLLDKLGIVQVRQQQALFALAAGTQNVNNQNIQLANTLKISADAYAKGNAVTEAAKKQYDSLSNQTKILHYQINNIAISFGQLFVPSIKVGISVLGTFTAAFTALPSAVGQTIGVVGSAVGAFSALAAGALLIGPRLVLARDAFTKLGDAIKVSLATQAAAAASNDAIAVSSLRASFSAGLHAKEVANEARSQQAAAAATELKSRATLEDIRAQQLAVRIEQELTAAIAAENKGKATSAELHRLNAAAMQEEMAVAERNVGLLKAESEAQALTNGNVQKGAIASNLFGRSLAFMKSGLGLTLGVLAAAAGALYLFGKQSQQGATVSKQYAQASEEVVAALQDEANGHTGAVGAMVAHTLAMSGAIAIAQEYGLTLQGLTGAIRGNAGDITALVDKIGPAFARGDKDAIAIVKTLKGLGNAHVASAQASKDQTAATKALGVAEGGAAVNADNLAASDQKLAKAQQDAAQAAEKMGNAVLGLVDALFAQKDAEFAVKDAQDAYAKALDAYKNRTAAVNKATLSLKQAQNEYTKSLGAVAAAEKKLASARKDQQRKLEDDLSKVADANYNYQNSIDKVKDAQDALDKLNAGATLDEITKATNKLADSRLNLIKATRKVSDAEFYLNYLQQEGASARDIVNAQDTLAEAKQGVADATQEVSNNEKELQKLQTGATPEELAKAERDLEKARRDQVQALQDVKDAEDQVAQDRSDIAKDTAYKDAQAGLTDAQLALADATDKVTKAQQDLADAKSGKGAAEELAKAQLALEEALYRQAKANVGAKKAMAEARGETFTTRDEVIALGDELTRLGLKINGPVADAIKNYGALIKAHVPPNVKTNIDVTSTGGGGAIGGSIADGFKLAQQGTDDYFKNLLKQLQQFDTREPNWFEKFFHIDTKHMSGELTKVGIAIAAGLAAIVAIILSPFEVGGLLIVGIGVGVAYIGKYLLDKLPKSFQRAFDGIGNYIKKHWPDILLGFISPLGLLVKSVSSHLDDIVDFFKKLPGRIGGFAKDIPGFFANIGTDILGFFTDLPKNIVGALGGLGTLIGGALGNVGQFAGKVVSDIVGFFASLPGKILDSIKDLPNKLYNDVFRQIPELFGKAMGFIIGLPFVAISKAFDIIDKLGPLAQSLFKQIVDLGVAAFKDALNIALDIGKFFADVFTKYLPAVTGTVVAFMKNLPSQMWNAFVGLVKSLWTLDKLVGDKVNEWAPKVVSSMVNFFKTLPGNMWDAFKAAASGAWNLISYISGLVAGWIKSLPGVVASVGSTIAHALWDAFTATLRAVSTGLGSFFRGLIAGLPDEAKKVFANLANVIKAPLVVVRNAFQAVLDAIASVRIHVPGIPLTPFHGVDIGFPQFYLPQLARGGITTGPMQALIGDNPGGHEVVIPLDKLYALLAPLMDIAMQMQRTNFALEKLSTPAPNTAGLTAGASTVINNHDEVTIHANTNADPEDIANEIAWRQLTRI